ncbi:MAG TPA: hypothetical protein VMF50_13565 [Candidatus Binataceae bacterium]|nr:hypothetical protein [Candidatus Binataceae bacterium]
MWRAARIAFACWFALSLSVVQAFAFPGDGGAAGYTPVSSTAPDTSGYTKDNVQSGALTKYLNSRRLPLVGAQVLKDPATGQRVVVLYGFVATDFGKTDAAAKTRAFLRDPSVIVENHVKIDPEIASLPKPSHHNEYATGESSPSTGSYASNAGSQAGADTNGLPGAQSYLDQQNQESQIQQYQNQSNPLANGSGIGGGAAISGSMAPLVALLGLLAATNGNSSFAYGSSSPLGMFGRSAPYQPNPYGGSPYAAPYGSPYGSPYSAPSNSYPPGAYPSSPYGNGSSPYPPGYSPYP